MLHFAVFGDVHGRVALMMTLARLWERHNDRHLTAILQVGDMGAFPDHTRLDDATARMARDDPDELGYTSYCAPTAEGERYLGGRGVPPVVFIRGNHEDFDYLAGFDGPSAVDPWGRLHYVPDGEIFELEAGARVVRVAGFGGIAPREEAAGRGKPSRHPRREASGRGPRDPRYFTAADAERAFLGAGAIDVLMTHAGPEAAELRDGSIRLTDLSRRVAPRAHLFGHHHVAMGPMVGPSGGLLVGLDHLEFGRRGELRERSAGILTLDGDATSFAFFDEDHDAWLREVRRDTYRHLLPP